MFLFGRWGWDGYLFGAEQEGSEMIGLIDDTYAHGFERREEVSDTIYNFGGYPHGYYSSAIMPDTEVRRSVVRSIVTQVSKLISL